MNQNSDLQVLPEKIQQAIPDKNLELTPFGTYVMTVDKIIAEELVNFYTNDLLEKASYE